MSAALELLCASVAVVGLFLASTVFFDVVHLVLHRMLGSRSALLRAIASPHGVHHRWIDRELRVHWSMQTANVWCHLVLEYLTQLAFTAVLALALPRGIVLGVAALQTLVFLMLLRDRGLDVNHRPQSIVEVARPMFFCPPAYHAQHHAHPDAFFSSYVKALDAAIGTALDLRPQRVALVGGRSVFGRALRDRLRGVGARDVIDLDTADDRRAADVDVLVLCRPVPDLAAEVEAYLRRAGRHQLPPEVWALVPETDVSVARHYYGDRRLLFRPLLVPDRADDASLARAARLSFFFIVRGAHLPRTRWRGFPRRRFLASEPVRPGGVPKVRSRADALLAA